MKKIFAWMISIMMVASFAGCAAQPPASLSETSNQSSSASSEQGNSSSSSSEPVSSVSSAPEEKADIPEAVPAGETTPITLTIGDTVLTGYLNDSTPAKSLMAQLPLTVSLNDSDNDFCGGSLSIDYEESDVQSGYQNGDLVFWPPAGNFVIFVDDEENSANTGDLVHLGKLTESQDALDALSGRIDVTIAIADTRAEETAAPETEISTTSSETEGSEVKIKITVGGTELTATLENNATTRAILEQMPMTLPMMDLYGREMCYRYGAYALPTDDLRSDGYAVGDIAYWAPGGSLVILYKQNGEQFERQHLGHIDSGVEVFEHTGDVEVTFEVAD